MNIYLIYYFTKFRADILHALQLSYVPFKAIKNQLIYNLNAV